MNGLDDIADLFVATTPANAGAPAPRKCYRHAWVTYLGAEPSCSRCGTIKDPARSRRNKNNGKRGRSDEGTVAALLGGRGVGPLQLPHDVEVGDYLHAQAKLLDEWPSLNQVVKWLDAITPGPWMRGVTLADTPGAGRKRRRLIVLDLREYAEHHGAGRSVP